MEIPDKYSITLQTTTFNGGQVSPSLHHMDHHPALPLGEHLQVTPNSNNIWTWGEVIHTATCVAFFVQNRPTDTMNSNQNHLRGKLLKNRHCSIWRMKVLRGMHCPPPPPPSPELLTFYDRYCTTTTLIIFINSWQSAEQWCCLLYWNKTLFELLLR